MGQEKATNEKEEHRGEKETLLSSTFLKIVAFIFFAVGIAVGMVGAVGTIYLIDADYYTEGFEHFVHDRMIPYVWEDVHELKWMYRTHEKEEAAASAADYLDRSNLTVEVFVDDELLWEFATEEDKDTPYSYVCYTSVEIERPVDYDTGNKLHSEELPKEVTAETEAAAVDEGTQAAETTGVSKVNLEPAVGESDLLDYFPKDHSIAIENVSQKMTFYVYVDPIVPVTDKYRQVWQECKQLSELSLVFPIAAVAGPLTALICFLFLLCSAGHHRGKEGITESVLSPFHFDVLTVLFAGVAFFSLIGITTLIFSNSTWLGYLIAIILLSLEAVWCMIWLREFALRLKMHNLLKHTLIASIYRGIVFLIKGLPLVINVAIVFMGISLLELFGIFLFGSPKILILWLAEKVILFAAVIYCALIFKRLQQGSEALAKGNLNYHVDTTAMILSFKEHGENLNNIAHGMTTAVEQRMKSERLKTELITNVSHDLKTPLTSIINYADLIGTLVAGAASVDNRAKTEIFEYGGVVSEVSGHVEGEEKKESDITVSEREQLSEYAEVLLRQSKRLKKLLEDLLEASKATTGNLEVHLQPCQVGVLLTQAVGEYEARFQEKGLELITRQPEGEVSVMADGRHIWRVFDNLLNNICKYAQENSRVYLTVESKFGEVDIVFRNMSKYPLDIMGEELKERFVRGDKSRHMEGNGLGLSIAGSLMELQGGQLDIVTDGDLFKVTIRIPTIRDDGPTAVIKKQQA